MFRKKYRITAFIAAFMALALFAGCTEPQRSDVQNTQTETQTTQPRQYKVRFMMQEQTLSMQVVQEGQLPDVPEVDLQGYIFAGWTDEKGQPVDVSVLRISEDKTLLAKVYPDLTKDAPYLFADEKGYIRAEEALTGEELSQALNAMAAKPAALANVTVPQEGEITGSLLLEVLQQCFSSEDLSQLTLDDGEPVTRGAFARIMNALTGRTGNVLLEEQALPEDLVLHSGDAADVLEAVLTHAHGDSGLPIDQAILQMKWQPGFTNQAGWLYYADENGKLLLNGNVGTLTFGADGYYTCGNEDLDKIAAELIFSFMEENPQADREELLMKAFEYSRDSFNYVNRGLLDNGQTGWEVEKALQMFDKGSGNCYNFAATFWILARFLGYDATCYSGKCLSNAGPHGWVDIVMDGNTYIFDPQLAWRETTGDRTNWGEDMFKIPEYLWHQWRYIYP